MKLPFRRLIAFAAMTAAFFALASAQEPASSPPPKSATPAAQKTPGVRSHPAGSFEQSIPEIVRASQATNIITEIVVFGCPVLIVALTVFGRYRRAQILHETLRVMVEKGATIPPELLVPQKAPASDFRRGVLLISLGAGLIGLLAWHAGKGIWSIGFVPLMLGIGYLVVAKLGAKHPVSPSPKLPS